MEKSETMYSIDDLLNLVTSEQADGVTLQVGKAPIVAVGGERRAVEGPAITAENGEQLLRSIANSRQMRALMKNGATEFVYTFRGSSRFLVYAKLQEENVYLELQRCAVC